MNPNDVIGPHERWLFGPGKAYDLPGLWLDASPSLSCLAEFPQAIRHPQAAIASLLVHGGITMTPRLAPLWRKGEFQPHFLPLILSPESETAISAHDPSQLARILADLAPSSRHLRLNFPLRSETINGATQEPAPLPPAVPGQGPVVLAVIDHGIAFAHKGLAGRMDYCWSQSALAGPGQTVPFGREFTRSQIEGQDEEELYRAAGLLGGANRPPMPLARRVAHGTHVLGTAAEGPQSVRLIAVDLPATALWDTSGFGSDMFLLSALHYIFDRADRIAAAHGLATVPVVVNISLGWSGGPHDGSSPIEAAIEEIVTWRRKLAPTLLVLPSGNMHLDQLSARLEEHHFTAGAAEIGWFAPPCDMTSSFAEIWLSDPVEGHVFTLTAPGGSVTTVSGPGWVDVRDGDLVVGLAQMDKPRDGRWRVTFCLAPTEPKALPPPPHGAAPSGEWRIGIRRPASARGVVQLRIQRDEDHAQGNTGARQSRLVDPAYQPFDAKGAPGQEDNGSMIARRDGLNGLATQAVSLNVGGSVEATGQAARYSSAGVGRGVDVSAPSERGLARPGILSWTTRSGGFAAQGGTSCAAPRVAAELARALLTATPPAGDGSNGASLLSGQPVPAPLVARLGHLRL